MEIFWFIVVGFVVTMFFILDGYDFGTGIIHLFYAKKEEDKVVIAKAAGLFWDANEVWLVAAGGLLFMAFPVFYASVFSGFYLPLIIVLWLIIFRALGLEFRGHFDADMWKAIWDKSFGISSLLLALFFGIALGNIARGVNLGEVHNGNSMHEGHFFFLPLWNSNFSPLDDHPGVIDWFTLSIGIIAVVTLAIHGANWIVLKTKSSINSKLKRVVFRLNIALTVLTILSLVLWPMVNINAFDNFLAKPYFLIFPLIYIVGLVGIFVQNKVQHQLFPMLCSSLLIIGGISSTFASMFPVILPSANDVNESLTIYNTAAPDYGLSVAVYWGIIGFILLFVYMIVQKRLLSGKIDHLDYGH